MPLHLVNQYRTWLAFNLLIRPFNPWHSLGSLMLVKKNSEEECRCPRHGCEQALTTVMIHGDELLKEVFGFCLMCLCRTNFYLELLECLILIKACFKLKKPSVPVN